MLEVHPPHRGTPERLHSAANEALGALQPVVAAA